MVDLDIRAGIEPGKGAGGLHLGQHIHDIAPLLDSLPLRSKDIWLLSKYWVCYRLPIGLSLRIDIRSGEICWISVEAPYEGCFHGDVQIGQDMDKVKTFVPGLTWDEDEEMWLLPSIPGVGLLFQRSSAGRDEAPALVLEEVVIYPSGQRVD